MSNKKMYERASLSAITFDAKDIITTSKVIVLPEDPFYNSNISSPDDVLG